MDKSILAATAYLFALEYNIILSTLNLKAVNSKFKNMPEVLMVVNTLKDTVLLGIILFSMFLR